MRDYTVKTFGEDTYGRHAIANLPSDYDAINYTPSWVHPTRIYNSYEGKHRNDTDQ